LAADAPRGAIQKENTMTASFKDALHSGDFLVTAEIGVPKGIDIEDTKHYIGYLKDKVHGLKMTDEPDNGVHLPSLVVCHLIKEMGGVPILQVSAGDGNTSFLQSNLLSAAVLGIDTVLSAAVTSLRSGGHRPSFGPEDPDSLQILRAIRTLESGRDLGGHALKKAPKFCAGAVLVLGTRSLEDQLRDLEARIRAGAEFVLTQPIYDMDSFRRFMDRARNYRVKILAGIAPLLSAGVARFMNRNVPGMAVPGDLISELEQVPKKDQAKKGIEIAARMVRTLKEEGVCHGVHLVAAGREKAVPEILHRASLLN